MAIDQCVELLEGDIDLVVELEDLEHPFFVAGRDIIFAEVGGDILPEKIRGHNHIGL